MTFALVVMTKNGREKLPGLFESAFPFVDKAVVLDTGSTDGAQDWIRAQPNTTLHESPFTNFAESRNVLMGLAKDCADWLLLMDDDWTLEVTMPKTEIAKYLDFPEVAGCGFQMH